TIVVSRGGGYGPGTPREGWDHDTPYVRRIFADVLNADVTVVTAELTLAPVKPEMAHLRELAEGSRARALRDAETTGPVLAQRRAPAGVSRWTAGRAVRRIPADGPPGFTAGRGGRPGARRRRRSPAGTRSSRSAGRWRRRVAPIPPPPR